MLTSETPPLFPLPTEPNVDNLLLDIDITPQMVRSKLEKLRLNKASGPDNVNVNLLKNCLELDLPLSLLFNKSLQSGHLPQDWKDANITPLFKIGSRTSTSNY